MTEGSRDEVVWMEDGHSMAGAHPETHWSLALPTAALRTLASWISKGCLWGQVMGSLWGRGWGEHQRGYCVSEPVATASKEEQSGS